MANLMKKAILQVFFELLTEKNIDKITVKDIVERCGITRGGFYYHFRDVYAVFETFLEMKTEELSVSDLSPAAWEEQFIQATAFLYENKRIVYNIYHSSHRDELMVYIDRSIHTVISRAVELASEGIPAKETDKEIISIFFSCALRGLFSEWADSGMKRPLDDLIRRSGHLFRGSITQALQHSAEEP